MFRATQLGDAYFSPGVDTLIFSTADQAKRKTGMGKRQHNPAAGWPKSVPVAYLPEGVEDGSA